MKPLTITLSEIHYDDLQVLHPLLEQSAGATVDLMDELEYFREQKPKGWFFARKDGSPCGLVRSFAQGARQDWGLGEIFCSATLYSSEREQILKTLLLSFIAAATFPTGFRLRFEISRDDKVLRTALLEQGFGTPTESYLHYSISLADHIILPDHKVSEVGDFAKAQPGDAVRTTEVFAYLHTVTPAEVAAWISAGNVYVQRGGNQVLSAAQVYTSGKTAEINRLASHPQHLRNGAAAQLLRNIHSVLSTCGIMEITLKVQNEKLPARALYEKLGYTRTPSKDQLWLWRLF